MDQDAALARTAEGRVLLYRSFRCAAGYATCLLGPTAALTGVRVALSCALLHARLHYAGRLNEASSLWPQALALYIKSDEVLAKAQQLLSASGDAKVRSGRDRVHRG